MSHTKTAQSWTKWLPLIALAGLMALTFAMGWHKYLSFKTIGVNYESLQAFIANNLLLAIAIYMAIYVAVVALSLPGALLMTLSGGLLFGWKIGIPATVLAATLGASLVYLIVKTSFGETLAATAGPWLGKLKDGFNDNALSYLLFLRLVPVFPFAIVNLAAALLGVPFRTYFVGTLLGIVPGTSAFSVAGAGLGSVVSGQTASYNACLAKNPGAGDDVCPYTIDTSALVTPELIAAFALLGVVALIPIALKRWSPSKA
jgi:uncharacterized membrane protein YdjX (TVP38/TMEM64 family)